MNNKQPEVKEILAANLKDLMEANTYNQATLSARAKSRYGLKISQKTISNILKQEHSVSIKHIETLATVFDLTPGELISERLEVKKQNAAASKPDRQELYELIDKLPAAQEVLQWVDFFLRAILTSPMVKAAARLKK